MTSPIGKSSRPSFVAGPVSRRHVIRVLKTPAGFTFLECMAAIAILSLGLVVIYRALGISLDIQNDLYYRLYARNFLETRTDRIRCYVSEGLLPGVLASPASEQVSINRRPVTFDFQTRLETLKGLESVAEMTQDATWIIRGQERRRQQTAYIHQPLPKK